MRRMQGVLWRKGVALAPQHLQAQDRYLQDLIDFQRSALHAHPWGFRSLEIDREDLDGGNLSVTRASGILPDGVAFDLPGADPAPEPRVLQEVWPDEGDSVTLYLALPELRIEGQNVSLEPSAGLRYTAEVVSHRDENTGLSEKAIEVARKNLRIVAETEMLEGQVSLPLARVVRTSDGAFGLDPGFVPPVVAIAASERLVSITRRLVELLVAKSASLSGARRQRARGAADFGVSDISNFWLLYTVNTHLPHVRHLHESRHVHPQELHHAMATLAGALTTFSKDAELELPSYAHTTPGPGFGRLDELLRSLLETVVPTRHVSLPLVETERSSVYATAIDQDRYFTAEAVYLAVAADLPPRDVLERVQRNLKISSSSGIDRLISQALSGVSVTHRPSPPSALPVKLDYSYFQLDTQGPDWEAIRMARNLAAHVPDELPGARMELLLLLPAQTE